MRHSDRVNEVIMENEKSADDWIFTEYASELYWWFDFFNIVFFNEKLPIPVLSFQEDKISTLGYYVPGRNSFGVRENINLNRLHLGQQPVHKVLATLLHEMTHSWQSLFGTPSSPSAAWYHNKEFQKKLDSFGIQCNEKGQHLAVKEPFTFLISKHLPDAAPQIKANTEIKKKNAKLKKWTCGCTNVRVAINDFRAQCLKCGNKFKVVNF